MKRFLSLVLAMKKIIQIAALTIVLLFAYMSMEYITYRLILRENELYIIASILFLSFFSLNISAIKRMDLPNKLTTSFVAFLYPLIIVLFGLGLLKLLLPVLE